MQNHPSSFSRSKADRDPNSQVSSPQVLRNSSEVKQEGEASLPRARGGGKKTDAVPKHERRNTVKEERPNLNTQ
jgi:hypothetical protein